MIAIFLDREFKGLQNNASLVVDRKNFTLVKRPIELNTFSCYCEPFTEDIQPTFVILKDDLGRDIIYSSLAGVPELMQGNKTRINGTDLKTLLSSDVLMAYGNYTENNTTGDVIDYIFSNWSSQVNQGSINYELVYRDDADKIELNSLIPSVTGLAVYDALEELQSYLSAYNLYIDTQIDLIGGKIIFYIGKTMMEDINNQQTIKLWEYDKKNYGKWVADVNETQGFVINEDNSTYTAGIRWILTSKNEITINSANRDIYPIKRRVFISNDNISEANQDALIYLLNSRYNENIEISAVGLNAGFETSFNVYVDKGEMYKTLPCGELRYNYDGLYEVQIGYRYTTVDFI